MKKDNYSFRDGNTMFLFTVLFFLVANFIVAGIVFAVSSATGQENLIGQDWVTYLNSFLIELSFFLVFFIFSKVKKVNIPIATRVKTHFDWKILLIVIGISLLTFFCSINSTGIINTWLSKIATLPLNPNSGFALDYFWQFLLAVLVFAVFPAICEEFLFRGGIYNSYRSKMSVVPSILLSAFAFTLIHFSIYQTLHQFIIGIVLGFLTYFTGTIVYGMIFHFLNNFLVLFLTYCKLDTSVVFHNFGTTEIILSFVIFLVGAGLVVGLFFLLRKYTKNKKEELNLEVSSKRLEQAEFAVPDKSFLGDFMIVVAFALAVAIWFVNSFGGGA